MSATEQNPPPSPWAKYRSKYRKDPTNLPKVYARNSVHRALKSGRLVRALSCESCGETTKTEAHHEDYSKRLIVKWLCAKCHCEIHCKTHCKHGHEFTPANIYALPSGRGCKTCRDLGRKKRTRQ